MDQCRSWTLFFDVKCLTLANCLCIEWGRRTQHINEKKTLSPSKTFPAPRWHPELMKTSLKLSCYDANGKSIAFYGVAL